MTSVSKVLSPFSLARRLAPAALLFAFAGAAAADWPEKDELRFGFIKLTDMVPLAVAYELGYFEDEGLYVTLEAQANWRVLYDRVASGELDGAHMLAPMPLGSATGLLGSGDIITPFTLSYNGAAITVSNAVWAEMKKHAPMDEDDGRPMHPIGASALQPVLDTYEAQGRAFNLGMTFPVGTHNYLLRYWLADGGIHPGFYTPGDSSGTREAEALLSVVPPPQMVPTMEAGTTAGYCVGEPWNQQAVIRGLGVPVVTSENIWAGGADKVFGISGSFAERHPNTTLRIVKALIRASHWLDSNDNANRPEAVRMISRPVYVGADERVIANSMTGTFEFEKGDIRPVPDFNTFFRGQYGIPYHSDAIWWLTQMRRWGHIDGHKPDGWYLEMAKKAYRPDIFAAAARALVAEGTLRAEDFPDLDRTTFIKPPQEGPLDGIVFDATEPNAYIDSFAIGLKSR